jgi:plasmid stabilization system protein ParE
MTIRWTEPAAESLQRIYAHTEVNTNGATASALVDALLDAVDRLGFMPMMGRTAGENGARELVRPPYVIIYKIVEDVVNVINIVHGSQRF